MCHEIDLALCQAVGQHPCLYNPKCRQYKDISARESVWQEISSRMGKSVESCKKRWKNIRDVHKRRERLRKAGHATKIQSSKWILDEALAFLDAANQEMEDSMQDEGEEVDLSLLLHSELIEEDHPEFPGKMDKRRSEGSELCSKRIKKEPESNGYFDRVERINGERENDDTDVFFRSMAMTVKKLPPNLIAQAKKDICTIVMDLELKSLT